MKEEININCLDSTLIYNYQRFYTNTENRRVISIQML